MADLPVVFMADDAYAGWARSFLASLRDQAPGMPVYCIPYSDQLSAIAALRAEFGFRMVDADYAAIDAFAAECFPTGQRRRRNLRKLAALEAPGAPFLYLDCDLLVTAPLAEVAALLAAAPADLVYWATSADWVYAAEARAEMAARFPRAPLFSAGNYAMLAPGFDAAAVMRLIRAEDALYRRVRAPTGFDQPLMNLACHLAGLRLLPLHEAAPGFTGEGFYLDPAITAEPDGRLLRQGARVVSVHWAGADKSATPPALAPLVARYAPPPLVGRPMGG
ncbi:hypothetical protein QWZ14_09300 [Paeniroseomonas aquatica]|uniref:Glycosyltransferase family 8 protein n=1 Tax=Paeniroseomonas aquatica TaxID=373043 RepID=A0ABT8A4E9_9PROT|nr:hypothetical protein [Paeniroseomonas aquatica]MDN3564558.1 hypothetical protein [Paeniroseomonas aquatica]